LNAASTFAAASTIKFRFSCLLDVDGNPAWMKCPKAGVDWFWEHAIQTSWNEVHRAETATKMIDQ